MTKQETVTISFIGSQELKDWLAGEALQQDRSVSSVIRTILETAKAAADEIAAQRQHNHEGHRA